MNISYLRPPAPRRREMEPVPPLEGVHPPPVAAAVACTWRGGGGGGFGECAEGCGGEGATWRTLVGWGMVGRGAGFITTPLATWRSLKADTTTTRAYSVALSYRR